MKRRTAKTSGKRVSAETVIRRDPAVGLVLGGQQLLVIGPTTISVQLESIDSALGFLQAVTFPQPLRTISRQHPNLVAQLVGAGAMRVSSAADPGADRASLQIDRPSGRRPICTRMVVAATGAVQSFALPLLLYSSFMPFATSVDVILTSSAERFVTRHSIEALGAKVWTDPFATDITPVPHMELAKSELMVVYPASAASLHRLAWGSADDLLSLVAAATTAPILLVPAMNGQMWTHPPIHRNVRRLVDCGFYVAVPSMMHEVSAGVGADPIFGGAGLGEHNLPEAMSAVLAEHAKV